MLPAGFWGEGTSLGTPPLLRGGGQSKYPLSPHLFPQEVGKCTEGGGRAGCGGMVGKTGGVASSEPTARILHPCYLNPPSPVLTSSIPSTCILHPWYPHPLSPVPVSSIPGAHRPATRIPGAHIRGTLIPGAHIPGTHTLGAHIRGAHIPAAPSSVPATHIPGSHIPDSHILHPLFPHPPPALPPPPPPHPLRSLPPGPTGGSGAGSGPAAPWAPGGRSGAGGSRRPGQSHGAGGERRWAPGPGPAAASPRLPVRLLCQRKGPSLGGRGGLKGAGKALRINGGKLRHGWGGGWMPMGSACPHSDDTGGVIRVQNAPRCCEFWCGF